MTAATLRRFFGDGSPAQEAEILSFIDIIWAQAGIDVNFLSPNTWDNTFANEGNTPTPPNVRSSGDLNQIVSMGEMAGVTNADPNVINMFFVNIPPGFGLCTVCPPDPSPFDGLTENSAAGIASLGGNGIAQFVV